MPGVTVLLVNQSQGTDQTIAFDEKGDFLFPIVPPGTYTLKLRLAGFQTLEKTGVVANANDRLMAGSFALNLGRLSENVLVTGMSSGIQLRSGQRARTRCSRRRFRTSPSTAGASSAWPSWCPASC